MGSASTGATKDASMPGEMGQVCSHAIVIKMIGASGELLEFNEDDPALLQMARSSYGPIGIVYECTFRIQRLRPMSVFHGSYDAEEFVHRLPELKARNHSIMFYLFPHDDKVTVEFRHYHEGDRFSRRWVWAVRNWAWKSFAPFYGRGGVPLFNQTKWITPAQARKAFGERIAKFHGFLEKYDPARRMLNDYFRDQFYD
jgi:hypothetical protein